MLVTIFYPANSGPSQTDAISEPGTNLKLVTNIFCLHHQWIRHQGNKCQYESIGLSSIIYTNGSLHQQKSSKWKLMFKSIESKNDLNDEQISLTPGFDTEWNYAELDVLELTKSN